ncbi:MAG: anti-sigma factor [Betaproteobacteria bacterium]|nr:MAG: anti-sigma factor [Betaproteobacteria bacterium]
MSPDPIREATLHAYVDGLLPPAERAEFERRLTQDPNMGQRVEDYARQRRLLKEAFDPVLQEPVPERMLAARIGARGSVWRRTAAAVAWIALGAAVGWGIRDQQARPELASEAELVERARVAHVIYTAEPRRAVEIAASQEQDMIRWLSKRMNAAVRVPNLTEYGFRALGGRLLPGSRGPACQLMYENAAGKRLTIYLSRDAAGTKPVRFSDHETVHVVFWSDGTLAFAVSAELGREELARIAASIARASRTQGG